MDHTYTKFWSKINFWILWWNWGQASFFYWSFSAFWNISDDLCNHDFYSWGKSDLNSEFIRFQNRYENNISNHTHNIIARNFKNLIRKSLFRNIHWNKKNLELQSATWSDLCFSQFNNNLIKKTRSGGPVTKELSYSLVTLCY